MKEIFEGIPAIRYEGAESKNPLAFKFYDADRVVLGKKMSEHLPFAMAWWHNRQEIAADGFDKAKRFTAQQLTQELHYNLDQCGYPHEEEEILDPMDLIQRYQEERASLNAEIDRVLSQITAILGGGQG